MVILSKEMTNVNSSFKKDLKNKINGLGSPAAMLPSLLKVDRVK